MIDLFHLLVVGAMLFGIGVAGLLINRKNLIVVLMCLELLLLSISTNFVAFSAHLGNLNGQIMVIFILAVAAAESAIGLGLFISMYRKAKTVNIEDLHVLKG